MQALDKGLADLLGQLDVVQLDISLALNGLPVLVLDHGCKSLGGSCQDVLVAGHLRLHIRVKTKLFVKMKKAPFCRQKPR